MNNIDKIVIEYENLTVKEQLKLWSVLMNFSHHELPSDKILIIGVVKKHDR